MAFSYRSEVGAAFGAALLLVTPLAPALAQTPAPVPIVLTAATTPQQLSAAIVAAVQALGPNATNAQIRAAIRNLIARALAAGMSIEAVTSALTIAAASFPTGSAAGATLTEINADVATFVQQAGNPPADGGGLGGSGGGQVTGGPTTSPVGNDYKPTPQ